jgi:hypothetical protein
MAVKRTSLAVAAVLCASAMICLAYVAGEFFVRRTAGVSGKQVILIAAVLQLVTASALVLASRTNRK